MKNSNFLYLILVLLMVVTSTWAKDTSEIDSTETKVKPAKEKRSITKLPRKLFRNFRGVLKSKKGKSDSSKGGQLNLVDGEDFHKSTEQIKAEKIQNQKDLEEHYLQVKKNYLVCFELVSLLGGLFDKKYQTVQMYKEDKQREIWSAINKIRAVEGYKIKSGNMRCLEALRTQFDLIYAQNKISEHQQLLFSCHLIAFNIFKVVDNLKFDFKNAGTEEAIFKKAIATLNNKQLPTDGYSFYSHGCDKIDLEKYIDVSEPNKEDNQGVEEQRINFKDE